MPLYPAARSPAGSASAAALGLDETVDARRAARPRARRAARARHRPPRRQAVERAARRRRHAPRSPTSASRRAADSTRLTRDGQLARHAALPRAGADRGRRGDAGERHLRARLRALRVPRRRAAVRRPRRLPSSASRTSPSRRPTARAAAGAPGRRRARAAHGAREGARCAADDGDCAGADAPPCAHGSRLLDPRLDVAALRRRLEPSARAAGSGSASAQRPSLSSA